MLLELGLPSFDTLLYNSRVRFGTVFSEQYYCTVEADFMICVCFLVVLCIYVYCVYCLCLSCSISYMGLFLK